MLLSDGSTVPVMSNVTLITMILGSSAHTLNALYYADQVVGTYWIFKVGEKRNDPSSPVIPKTPTGAEVSTPLSPQSASPSAAKAAKKRK